LIKAAGEFPIGADGSSPREADAEALAGRFAASSLPDTKSVKSRARYAPDRAVHACGARPAIVRFGPHSFTTPGMAVYPLPDAAGFYSVGKCVRYS
jgi:hypothetical protein